MAVSFNEAKKTATGLNGSVNACKDFGDAYYFYDKKNAGLEVGGSSGLVVLKDSGKTRNISQYMLDRSGPVKGRNVSMSTGSPMVKRAGTKKR